jgi:hypothetical protein
MAEIVDLCDSDEGPSPAACRSRQGLHGAQHVNQDQPPRRPAPPDRPLLSALQGGPSPPTRRPASVAMPLPLITQIDDGSGDMLLGAAMLRQRRQARAAHKAAQPAAAEAGGSKPTAAAAGMRHQPAPPEQHRQVEAPQRLDNGNGLLDFASLPPGIPQQQQQEPVQGGDVEWRPAAASLPASQPAAAGSRRASLGSEGQPAAKQRRPRRSKEEIEADKQQTRNRQALRKAGSKQNALQQARTAGSCMIQHCAAPPAAGLLRTCTAAPLQPVPPQSAAHAECGSHAGAAQLLSHTHTHAHRLHLYKLVVLPAGQAACGRCADERRHRAGSVPGSPHAGYAWLWLFVEGRRTGGGSVQSACVRGWGGGVC